MEKKNNQKRTIWLTKPKYITKMIYVIYNTGEIISIKQAQKYNKLRTIKLKNSYEEYPTITINWLVLLGEKLPVQTKLF